MQYLMERDHVQELKQHRIYFSQDDGDRFTTDQVVLFDEDGTVEPYAAILQGIEIPTIGSFSHSLSGLPPSTRIGRYCSISWNVRVMALNHHVSSASTSSFSYDPRFIIFRMCLEDDAVESFSRYGGRPSRPNRIDAPIIEHDVWIGQDAMLARGITLGTGCVIGAGAVVTGSVPPYAIVGGNPACLIRFRFPEEIVADLLESCWWNYKVSDFAELRYDDPVLFLAQLRQAAEAGIDNALPASKACARRVLRDGVRRPRRR